MVPLYTGPAIENRELALLATAVLASALLVWRRYLRD